MLMLMLRLEASVIDHGSCFNSVTRLYGEFLCKESVTSRAVTLPLNRLDLDLAAFKFK